MPSLVSVGDRANQVLGTDLKALGELEKVLEGDVALSSFN